MELSYKQFSLLIKNLPRFENSYETSSQKGELGLYDITLAIPTGKKAYVWHTFYKDKDISYLLDINREKQINQAKVLDKRDMHPLSHNTIVFGTIIENEENTQNNHKYFVIEDIHYYNGIPLKNVSFLNKLSYIKEYISICNKINEDNKYKFYLPYMWNYSYNSNELPYIIDDKHIHNIGYVPHHLQYRSLEHIVPYINVVINKRLNLTTQVIQQNKFQKQKQVLYTLDFNKPQYRYNSVFLVEADIQNDIYHLYAYGNKKSKVYYGITLIPDYKTSVMMNNLFRKIKENQNLDAIEESDDEEDFQNTSPEKYVNLNLTIAFDCKFHRKFKKWFPLIRAPVNTKIIHINKLVRDYY